MMGWKTEALAGRKVPTRPHLVDCSVCAGVGQLTDGHPNDPYTPDVECEGCGGAGQTRCADDGCCDFDPPDDE